MKIRRTIALALIMTLLTASVSSCSFGSKKLHGKPAEHVNTSAGLFHPEDKPTEYITSLYNVCSWKGDYEYDPPVAGSELNVYCGIHKTSEGNEPEITLYIFKDDHRYSWGPEDAIVSDTGSIEHGNTDTIRFTMELPEDIETGDYIFVFTADNDKVDCMFEQQIVSSPDESNAFIPVDKPVIYMYPEEDTEAYVSLNFEGDLTCTYPQYSSDFGWHVEAHPDGRITDLTGERDYNYLYWEGIGDVPDSFDRAICVRGEDTAAFLEEYLEAAGLTYGEIDDFITYWLPKMEGNAYNLISFPTEEYEQMAQLNVSPAPDTMIRVYMVFTPLDEEVQIEEGHELLMPEGVVRTGYTVVEWGGSEV